MLRGVLGAACTVAHAHGLTKTSASLSVWIAGPPYGRWQADRPNRLWDADVCHGPPLGGRQEQGPCARDAMFRKTGCRPNGVMRLRARRPTRFLAPDAV
jgi:hypothetical protein